MSYKIFRIEELNLSNFFYQSPRKIINNNHETIFIPMVYRENENVFPVLFQLPTIKINDSYKKDSLLLPINTNNYKKTEVLKSFLNNLDEKLINDFKVHGKKWCKEVIHNLKNIEYKALVNEIDDDEAIYNNGVLNIQLEKFSPKVYNEKKELCDNYDEVLQKGCTVQCILELKGLMIQLSNETNEIYPFIKTHQIRYIEEKLLDVNLDNYSFLDSDVEIKVSEMPKKSALQNLEEAINENDSEEDSDEDSDEESDDDDEEETEEEEYNEDNMDKLLNDESETSDSDDELLRKIAKEESSEEEKKKPKGKKFYMKKH